MKKLIVLLMAIMPTLTMAPKSILRLEKDMEPAINMLLK